MIWIVGAIVVVFILALWWFSFHPDFGLRPLPPLVEPSYRDRSYGPDDPGPIATEAEWRIAPYEPPPARPGGTVRIWL